MVNQVTGNPFEHLNGNRPAQDNKSSNELGQDQFMTLMLAQMKNQDPMSPMENGEFIAQLAQFRTVTGVEQLNNSFNSFAGTMQSSQALQASTLVGREVLIPGNVGNLPMDGAFSGTIDLPSASGDVRYNVYSSSGALVAQMGLGAQPAGQVPFVWDGRMPDGSMAPAGRYQVEANALIAGERQAMDTYVSAKVESVSLSAGREPVLNLANVGPMGFSQVREIR